MSRRVMTKTQRLRASEDIIEQIKKAGGTFEGTIASLIEKVITSKSGKIKKSPPYTWPKVLAGRVVQLQKLGAVKIHRASGNKHGRVNKIELIDEAKIMNPPRSARNKEKGSTDTNPPNPTQPTTMREEAERRDTRRKKVLEAIILMMRQKIQAGQQPLIRTFASINEHLAKTNDDFNQRTLTNDLRFLEKNGLVSIKPYVEKGIRKKSISISEDQSLDTLTAFFNDQEPATMHNPPKVDGAANPEPADEEAGTNSESNPTDVTNKTEEIVAQLREGITNLEKARDQIDAQIQDAKSASHIDAETRLQIAEQDFTTSERKLHILSHTPESARTLKFNATLELWQNAVREKEIEVVGIKDEIRVMQDEHRTAQQSLGEQRHEINNDIEITLKVIEDFTNASQ